MRQLKLQDVNMSGPDVSDWQKFLKGRGHFPFTVDGKFGPRSDQGTRGYQASAGLDSHGVVDRGTMQRAVGDGYAASTGANLAGIDASIDCSPFLDQIRAEGLTFVFRYYSHNPAKQLTPAEGRRFAAAAIPVVAVFEDSNNAAGLFSSDAGAHQAQRALQQAAAIGQPAGSAIYFAVDFDPTPAEVAGPVTAYFTAVKAALDAASTQYAVGVYGSGLTCRAIRDAGLARFTWLTGSTGFAGYADFLPHADIVQLAPERVLASPLSIDDDIAQSAEFGQFRVPGAEAAAG